MVVQIKVAYTGSKGENLEEIAVNTVSLSKYLAQAGVCARRRAVELVKLGAVACNGQVETEPGALVKSKDQVRIDLNEVPQSLLPMVNRAVLERVNQAGNELDGTWYQIVPARKIYIMLNKPRDYVTTVSDERGRKSVLDLLKGAIQERIYPVGRLDRNTTGLLLLTNDGDLAQKLAHPRYQIQKVYHVLLDRPLRLHDFATIKKGVRLYDGVVQIDDLQFIPRTGKKQLLVTLHSGKYRIVRRMLQELEYKVKYLDRVQYASLFKQAVRVGQWRMLTKDEVKQLRKL